jgi:hypothetical protein
VGFFNTRIGASIVDPVKKLQISAYRMPVNCYFKSFSR